MSTDGRKERKRRWDKPRGEMSPEELQRARRRDKQVKYLKQIGRPAEILPHELEPLRERIRDCHSRGMSYGAMGEQTGVIRHIFGDIARGKRQTIHRTTYDKIKNLRFAFPETGVKNEGALIPKAGTVRRVQALRAIGFPRNWLGKQLGMTGENTSFTRNEGVKIASAERIAALYDKLKDADPADFGIPAASIKKSKTFSPFPPPSCWDDDTIDDPDAFPEWTGECGTVGGYYLHLKYDIQVDNRQNGKKRIVLCQPCVKARQEAVGASAVNRKGTDDDGIKAALLAGRRYRDTAEEFHVSARTVQRLAAELKETGWVPARPGPRPKEA